MDNLVDYCFGVHWREFTNPEPSPQRVMSNTTSANVRSPRGSVKSLKSVIPLRCHGTVLFHRLRLTVGEPFAPSEMTPQMPSSGLVLRMRPVEPHFAFPISDRLMVTFVGR